MSMSLEGLVTVGEDSVGRFFYRGEDKGSKYLRERSRGGGEGEVEWKEDKI